MNAPAGTAGPGPGPGPGTGPGTGPGRAGTGADAFERCLSLVCCPNCGAALAATATGVACAHGHRFDRARQGHLTLFGPRGRRFPGDTPGQVAARERFLGGGWYAPVADAVAAALAEGLPTSSSFPAPSPGPTPAPTSPESFPVVAEFGAGTGYYLSRALDLLRAGGGRPLGLGAEISAAAARRLARADADLAALVCDTWEPLPIADGVVDALAVVFAPRNPTEFARVLRPGGVAVVAVPGDGHLEPLRGSLDMLGAEPGKDERLAADFAGWEPLAESAVDRTVALSRDAARDLALMGPSGVHLDEAVLDSALDALLGGAGHGDGDGDGGGDDAAGITARIHVRVRTYRRPV